MAVLNLDLLPEKTKKNSRAHLLNQGSDNFVYGVQQERLKGTYNVSNVVIDDGTSVPPTFVPKNQRMCSSNVAWSSSFMNNFSHASRRYWYSASSLSSAPRSRSNCSSTLDGPCGSSIPSSTAIGLATTCRNF
jgi:hypothetical protein